MKSFKNSLETNSTESKEILQEDYSKLSGGTKKALWTKEEEYKLSKLCEANCYGSSYDYEKIAEELNSIYHNNRTPGACRQRYQVVLRGGHGFVVEGYIPPRKKHNGRLYFPPKERDHS